MFGIISNIVIGLLKSVYGLSASVVSGTINTVLTGKLVLRGGGQEFALERDVTAGYLRSNPILVNDTPAGGGTSYVIFQSTANYGFVNCLSLAGYFLDTSGQFASGSGSADVGFQRAAAGEWKVTNGSTGLGAIQSLRTTSSSAAAITTTRVLAAADSGGTFSVAKTSAYAITLPTPSQGMRFKFMVLDTGAFAVTISDGSAHFFGMVSVNNVNVAMTGTTISLTATGSVGDWLEIQGIDATHYLVIGACKDAADITIA